MRLIIALYILCSSQISLAHRIEIPFLGQEQAEFDEMTDNQKKTHGLANEYCKAFSKNLDDCIPDTIDNIQMTNSPEVTKSAIAECNKLLTPNSYGGKIDPTRAHLAEGLIAHEHYVIDKNGDRNDVGHRHTHSESNRQFAKQKSETDTRFKETMAAASPTSTTVGTSNSVSGGVDGKVEGGLNAIATAVVGIGADVGASHSNTKTKTRSLTQEEIDRIDVLAQAAGERAYQDPSRAGISSDVLCYEDEKQCYSPDISNPRPDNDSYSVEASKKNEKENKAKEDFERKKKQEEAERQRRESLDKIKEEAEEKLGDFDGNTTNERSSQNEFAVNDRAWDRDEMVAHYDPSLERLIKQHMDRCIESKIQMKVQKISNEKHLMDISKQGMSPELDDCQKTESDPTCAELREASVTTFDRNWIQPTDDDSCSRVHFGKTCAELFEDSRYHYARDGFSATEFDDVGEPEYDRISGAN